VPAKRKYDSQNDSLPKGSPQEDQIDQFVERLVAKTPNSATHTAEQRSDHGSFIDPTFPGTGDGLNTFDFNFDFGNYDDPFADIMRMAEATLGGGSTNITSAQTLWPWN
jgi:hypothetical protein